MGISGEFGLTHQQRLPNFSHTVTFHSKTFVIKVLNTTQYIFMNKRLKYNIQYFTLYYCRIQEFLCIIIGKF
jgi:hypothetical protein